MAQYTGPEAIFLLSLLLSVKCLDSSNRAYSSATARRVSFSFTFFSVGRKAGRMLARQVATVHWRDCRSNGTKRIRKLPFRSSDVWPTQTLIGSPRNRRYHDSVTPLISPPPPTPIRRFPLVGSEGRSVKSLGRFQYTYHKQNMCLFSLPYLSLLRWLPK